MAATACMQAAMHGKAWALGNPGNWRASTNLFALQPPPSGSQGPLRVLHGRHAQHQRVIVALQHHYGVLFVSHAPRGKGSARTPVNKPGCQRT